MITQQKQNRNISIANVSCKTTNLHKIQRGNFHNASLKKLKNTLNIHLQIPKYHTAHKSVTLFSIHIPQPLVNEKK